MAGRNSTGMLSGACPSCPHRTENSERIYLVWGEIPTPGRLVSERMGESHACHETLDLDSNETAGSSRCRGYHPKRRAGCPT